MAASYMIIIGERDALAWILTTERMAFPDYRAREVAALKAGDELFLYTTRGCFHNPGVIAGASSERRNGRGVELSPLVPELDGFPNKTGWAPRLRRPLVPLSKRDAALLRRRLQQVADAPKLAVDEYVARAARRRSNADEAARPSTSSPG